jgi:hypothetical protein
VRLLSSAGEAASKSIGKQSFISVALHMHAHQSSIDASETACASAQNTGESMQVELTRFRGHLILGKEGDHDAEITRSLPT